MKHLKEFNMVNENTAMSQNPEYIIVNKTALLERIAELERQIKESSIEETGEYDFQCEDKIEELNLVLSQSTPFIPENIKPLQELIDEGYDPYHSAHHLQVQRMLKVIQEYLSNLKLDI